ncbi:MAG TPA: hypothetical protein DCE24_08360 [Porphyromonadaceae bacterium]|nr:hypothetical protein [Porphyromonadaceae bacterium]
MNEKLFILCIELNSKRFIQKFENLTLGIHKPIKIIDNVYFVRFPYMATSAQVREALFGQMGSTDFNVFIMKSSIDASWRLSGELDNWLAQNI